VRVGEGQFLTLPGRAFYDIGLSLKERREWSMRAGEARELGERIAALVQRGQTIEA